jgi:CheY-like chemotaxis protein
MQLSPKGKKILVVDDERIIADTIVAILLRHGFEATAAYSGSEAIERAGQFCPDSVISDVVMPGINGIETAISLRKIARR